MHIRKYDDKYSIVEPETSQEISILKKFPIGVPRGSSRIIPTLYNVVSSAVERLKKISKVTADKNTSDLVSSVIRLSVIPDTFKYYTTPLEHQAIALRYFYTFHRVGLLLDPGLGKTKVALDGIKLVDAKKTVIVCPKSLIGVWHREVAKHRPDLSIYTPSSCTYQLLLTKEMNKPQSEKGNKKIEKLKKRLEEESKEAAKYDIIVANYDQVVDGWRWLREVINPEMIVIDEFLIKDPESIRTKVLTVFAEGSKYRMGLSGTLVNNSPLDVFAPIRFLEPGLVGHSFPNFRDRYANMVPIKDANDIIRGKFIASFKDVAEVRSILESCCIVMEKNKWLTLPGKEFYPLYVPMTPQQDEMYWDLAKNYVCKVGEDFVEVDSPLTLMCKLSQVSSGFIYKYKDDALDDLLPVEDKKKPRKLSDRETIFLPSQPKIDKLRELILSTLKSEKFILWYTMSAEYELIHSLLIELKVNFMVIRGGEPDAAGKVEAFNRDPTCQILLCQSRTVNYGITVLGTSVEDLDELGIEILPDLNTEVYTQVYYSIGYSLELFLQQQDRTNRIGQKHTCKYYLLLSDNPTEKKVYQALHDKMQIRKSVLIDWVHELRASL